MDPSSLVTCVPRGWGSVQSPRCVCHVCDRGSCHAQHWWDMVRRARFIEDGVASSRVWSVKGAELGRLADWQGGRLDRVIRSGLLHSPAKQTLWTPELTGRAAANSRKRWGPEQQGVSFNFNSMTLELSSNVHRLSGACSSCRMTRAFPGASYCNSQSFMGSDVDQAPPDRVTRGLVEDPRGIRCTELEGVRGARTIRCTTVPGDTYRFFQGQWQEKHLVRAFRWENGLSSTIVGILSTVSENDTALARLTSRLLLRDNPISRTSECEKTPRTGPCLIECGHLASTRKEELATGRQGGSV